MQEKKPGIAGALSVVSAVFTAVSIAALIAAWILRFTGSTEASGAALDICVFIHLLAVPIAMIIAATGLVIASNALKTDPRAKSPRAVCIASIILMSAGCIAYFFLRITVI